MTSTLAEHGAPVSPVDFRRPSRISRDAILALETSHDAFARRLSTAWSSGSYAAIEIEHVATEQLSVDDFVRSLPSPTALGFVRVDAIGTTGFLQIDLPFALLLVERLLGGAGDAAEADIGRRPTDLEVALLTHDLFGPATAAIDEALRDLGGEPSELVGFEAVPQPLQLGSPAELLVLLTYHVELRGDLPAQGLVTLAYPVGQVVPVLDRLTLGPTDDDTAASASAAMTASLMATEVELAVQLSGSLLPAATIAGLRAGDIVRLDHRSEAPALLVCDERTVGTAHLGRRGRRVAAQIITPPTPR
ncbi:MAG: FliM/FliN family flagellar motor switch protein [Nitriliruptoraceae bacterium]|nr:FliM/FliN family flagellar motor switch protein [Nitriliruptoraceae bacterium]